MKLLYFILFILGFETINLSCSKSETTSSSVAALTVVNAVVGSNNFVTNFSGNTGIKGAAPFEWYYDAAQVGFGSFQEFSLRAGATPLSVSPITDTLLTLWNGSLTLTNGGIYSLFFVGPDSMHLDTLFTVDNLAYYGPTDSTVGVRFVNLSPGGNPVSVDISGQPNGSEAQSISYKGVTPFKNYPAVDTSIAVVFEFRDVQSGTLLANITLSGLGDASGSNPSNSNNNYRFRNFTVALMGLSGSQSTSLINNY